MDNVFSGPNSIRDFLNPGKSAPLPLVEIPAELNPFTGKRVRIFAKMMNMVPLANVKALPAYNMLLELEKEGKLKDADSIIESSSGNTAFSLAVMGRAFGINRTKSIVSNEVGQGKLKLLRFFGNEITINKEPICPDPADRESGIYKAKQIGSQKGWINPGQYENDANPDSHFKWTGPQIWEQTRGKISVFCSGMGTTGTMVGTSKYLKKMNSGIATVGVTRRLNNPIPGVRTVNLLKEIAFDWKSCTDTMVEIGTKESYALSLELCRSGLMVGPSSGFALAGLFEYLNGAEIDKLKNGDGELLAVFICPDTPFPYIDDYFEYLGSEKFPVIENKDLLQSHSIPINQIPSLEPKANEKAEKDCKQAYDIIYNVERQKLWENISDWDKYMNPGIKIIDVRSKSEFDDYHMPGSENADYYELLDSIKDRNLDSEGKIFFVCTIGLRSRALAVLAREQGIDAYSIKDGLIEWSRLNYPRARADKCVKRYNLKRIPDN